MEINNVIKITSKKRIAAFDFLRLMSIIGVIFGHTSYLVAYVYCYSSPIQVSLWISLQAIFRDAIPILFMISGALMLNPKKKMPIKTFYKKYVLKIALSIIFFITFYDFIGMIIFNEQNKTIFSEWNISVLFDLNTYKIIITDILTANLKSNDLHLWFIYVIFILYILVPPIKFYLSKTTKKFQLWVLFIGTVLFIVIPNIACLIDPKLELGIAKYFQDLVYFLTGHYIFNYIKVTNKLKITCMIIYIILTIPLLYAYVYIFWNNLRTDNAFLYLATFVHAILLFLWASTWKFQFKFSQYMYKYTMGIYLFHFLYSSPRFATLTNNATISFLLGFIIITSLCFITTWICKKIPFIKTYII